MQPIIGITMNTRCNLTSNYVLSIAKAGGSPLILSRVPDLKSILPILHKLDGILFSGGTDISPHYYSEYPKYGLGEVEPGRDQFEYDLLKYCLKHTTYPILGICRGFQLLNIAHGGTLYQCLERERPECAMHWLFEKYPLDYPTHQVSIHKTSRLFSMIQKASLKVNSFHHQGIKELGEGLKPVGFAEDGILEVLEKKGERLVIGVQWHPEMMSETCKDSQKLFQCFIEECKLPTYTTPSNIEAPVIS